MARSKKRVSLSIHSQKLADALVKHGVVPNKADRMATPELANNSNFWRAVVDGNGYLYDGGEEGLPKVILTGYEKLLGQFCSFIKKISPECEANIKPVKGENPFRVIVSGIQAVRLIHALYKNATTYLDRNMEIAHKVMGDPRYDLES